MLYKSGVNLSTQLIKFIESSTFLCIFVPYIKLEALKGLLASSHTKCKIIVVRWEPKDLILGSSDLEVFDYCKENKIALYRNPRIHLKAFVDQYQRCFLGSANISSRALNLPESNLYNHELATELSVLTIEDKLYFETILSESILITDSIYQQISNQLPIKVEVFPYENDFELRIVAPDKDFLISSLPMSSSVKKLIQVYLDPAAFDKIDQDCMIHDIALYRIPLGLEADLLEERLLTAFFEQPFIKSFLIELATSGEMYFGKVKEWIHSNCTDVPIPRKWEITKNIQILYTWLVELGNGKLLVDQPNHSQRIRLIKQ